MPVQLSTSRLVINPLQQADVAAFVAYRQDPEVARWQSWNPDYSEAQAAALVADQPGGDLPPPGEWLQLAVRERSTGLLCGDVAVHVSPDATDTVEIGMTLARRFQHRGIAAEAVGRVLHFLFTDAGARRVVADCDSRNIAVARLLRRLGLRQQSHRVAAEFTKGEWITVDGYAVLAEDFQARELTLRAADPSDAGPIGELYLAAVRSELPYLQPAHPDDEVRAYFRDVVLPGSRVLVAVRDGEVVGFGAYTVDHLDHLYVRPDALRQGVGGALLRRIQDDSPGGLQLFAFQRNWPARAFYRRHGFVATAFASGADNEEHEPDVAMRWAPEPSVPPADGSAPAVPH